MRPTKQARICHIIACSTLILLLVSTLAFAAPRANKKSTLLSKKAKLQTKISQVRSRLHQVKVQVVQKKKQLNGVEHRLLIARGNLQYMTLKLQREKIELQRATSALRDAKADYTDTCKEAGARLVSLYERGEPGYLDILFASDNIGDLLQRAQLAKFAMERDRSVLDDLATKKAKVARYQGVVQAKTKEVSSLRTHWAVVHEAVADRRTEVAHQLTETKEAKQDLEAELTALERDSKAVASMLRDLMRSAGGKRRYRTVYAGPVGGLPVNGRITSRFGYRFHPVLHYRRLHTGIDISAPSGAPIYAAGGGEVLWAGWRGGYGNAVIIDHGGGRATLYGHMSSVGVRAGQVVRGRQFIGSVGSTGISTGPHVHYELRINGSPVNPL